MNSKVSKKIGTGVMVLLITVFFIPALAGAFGPGDGRQGKGFDGKERHRPVLGVWREPRMVQELGLTEAQVKQVREVDFNFRDERLVLKAQLDRLRLQMDRAFYDDVVDDAVVLTLAEKISDLKGKMFVQDMESRLALGKILNADQIQKLRLYEMHPKKKNPRQSKERISGQPSGEKPGDKKRFES